MRKKKMSKKLRMSPLTKEGKLACSKFDAAVERLFIELVGIAADVREHHLSFSRSFMVTSIPGDVKIDVRMWFKDRL